MTGRIVEQWITTSNQGGGIYWNGNMNSGKPVNQD